ncbi:MAG: SRPBCC family protein [Nitrospirales bacterium]
MSMIQKSIEVNVPVKTAYNQWTQFEEFPKFMEGIEQVTQINDTRLHWKASIAGQAEEWDAEITEQIPDQRIAWTSKGGAMNTGLVTFYPVSDAKSKLTLQMEYVPSGAIEKMGDAMGLVTKRVEGDLKRFKDFIETRGRETGEWRGTVK